MEKNSVTFEIIWFFNDFRGVEVNLLALKRLTLKAKQPVRFLFSTRDLQLG